MYQLCFLSSLSSTEWAAWTQALGSIGAIVAAAWIAIHQSNQQHSNAIDLHQTELLSTRIDIAKTLSALAVNASKAMKYISAQLKDRESVHNAADGLIHSGAGKCNALMYI